MATCSACGTTILFGGKRLGDLRFCNDKCLARGRYLAAADQVPEAAVSDLARRVHSGLCPKCHGPGPVDVHNAYSVWSALYITSWKTQPHVVCRSCGTKAQVWALVSSLALGWWGFPWGIFVTPLQIGRNLNAMRRKVSFSEPSPELLRLTRLTLASERAAPAPAPPPSRRPNA